MISEKQLATIERKRKEKFEREHKLIDGIDHKFCNKHNIYFPEEDIWFPANTEYFYYNDKNKTDYLHPECIRCGIVKARIYQINHLEESYASHKKYRGTVKYQKWDRKHKDDNEEYLIEYRKTDKFKKSVKRSNEFRNLHKQHNITEEEWESCKKYFDYKCAYCGLSLKDHYRIYARKPQKIDFHKEHYVNDGVNNLSNCLPSCITCNNSKKKKTFEEWYPELSGVFNEERLEKIQKWLNEDYKLYIKQESLKV